MNAVNILPNVAWPDAVPEWEDLTSQEHDEHRAWCESCGLCDGFRVWGTCGGCGAYIEGDDFERSLCCSSRIVAGSDEFSPMPAPRTATPVTDRMISSPQLLSALALASLILTCAGLLVFVWVVVL